MTVAPAPSTPRPVTPLGILAASLAELAGRRDLPADVRDQLDAAHALASGLDPYVAACTTPESPALAALAARTAAEDWADGGLEQEMLSGHVEGQALKLLVHLGRARRVLDVGMFTGYSSLAMAEALPADGTVVACELDAHVAGIAQECFDAAPDGHKIAVRVGPARDTLAALAAAGDRFDLVFLDADKPGYTDYLELVLEGDLLTPHGVVCVDNTLLQGDPWLRSTPNGDAIAAFNRAVADDPRVEQVLLPLRDGLTLVPPGVSGVRQVARTVGMLGLLTAVAPLNLAVTGAALARTVVVRPHRAVAEHPRTVLVSGGKMTKALQLARSFHAAGHRVVLVEQGTYRLTGHRFSRSVDAFRVVPAPDDPGYTAALLDVVRTEGVDVYVPVCSPVASYHDALAKAALSEHCEVVHLDPDELRDVDDKDRFAELAASLGLRVPETHRITDPAQVSAFDFAATGRTYILKSIAYDPVRRLDLTPLPRPTPAATAAFAAALPISADNPWILQELVVGQEYCTHGTVRGGHVQVWACCESSASQLNYAEVDKPAIEAWVRAFCAATGMTGQLSFDFIEEAGGEVVAIECNPRTHSAITMFHDHPDLARAYLEDGVGPLVPRPGSRPTYWLYHEVWRLVTQPGLRRARLRTILAGKDAVFALDDPLPFLLLHHLSIPWLLVRNLLRGGSWVKIDVNIGKLVEPGGD